VSSCREADKAVVQQHLTEAHVRRPLGGCADCRRLGYMSCGVTGSTPGASGVRVHQYYRHDSRCVGVARSSYTRRTHFLASTVVLASARKIQAQSVAVLSTVQCVSKLQESAGFLTHADVRGGPGPGSALCVLKKSKSRTMENIWLVRLSNDDTRGEHEVK